jgi:hypothetical protein
MADYYTQFCFALPALTAAQATIAQVWLNAREQEMGEDVFDFTYTFEFDLIRDNAMLFFSHGDHGDGSFDEATATAAELGKVMGFTHRIGASCAKTCSRPRQDAFEGCAVIIDFAEGSVVDSVDLAGWVHGKLRGYRVGG